MKKTSLLTALVVAVQLGEVLRKYNPVQLSYMERMRNIGNADKTQWSKNDLIALAKLLQASASGS